MCILRKRATNTFIVMVVGKKEIRVTDLGCMADYDKEHDSKRIICCCLDCCYGKRAEKSKNTGSFSGTGGDKK